ncbi:MAG: hypothetical protein ABIJ00_03615 [Candidatus Eisenbacteria bacterium]
MRRRIAGFVIMSMVLLIGCAPPPRHVMLPEEPPSGKVIFSNGVPFASVSTDCAGLVVSLEPVSLGGAPYFRAYLAYRNLSSSDFLLQPSTSIILTATKGTRTLPAASPEIASRVLSSMESQKATNQAAQAVLGAIQMLAVQPTSVEGPGGTWFEIDDTADKVDRVANHTVAGIAATQAAWDPLIRQVSQSVLRRNTIFPGRDAGGFVYFPAPYLGRLVHAEVQDCTVHLDIETQCGPVSLDFTPIREE